MRSVVAFILSIILTAALLVGLLYALVGNFAEFDFSIPLLSDSTVVLDNKESPDFAEPTKPKPNSTDKETDKKDYFKFSKSIAPVQVGVYPLVKKDGLPEIATKIKNELREIDVSNQFREE